MDLSHLRPAKGAVRKRKRVGRGPGSGHGKTATRGHKGKGSRTGGNTPARYEGGQMPIHRRLPKRGFHSPNKVEYNLVQLSHLARFAAGSVVGPDELRQARIVRRTGPIKVLAGGKLGHAVTLKVHAISAGAREQVTAAGGTVEVLG